MSATTVLTGLAAPNNQSRRPSSTMDNSFPASTNPWFSASGQRAAVDRSLGTKTGSSALLDDSEVEISSRTLDLSENRVSSLGQIGSTSSRGIWSTVDKTASSFRNERSRSPLPVGGPSAAANSTLSFNRSGRGSASQPRSGYQAGSLRSNGFDQMAAAAFSNTDRYASTSGYFPSALDMNGIKPNGARTSSTTRQPSPPTEEGPGFMASSYNGRTSAAASRNNSIPPSRHSDDAQTVIPPATRYIPDSFRRPSTSTNHITTANLLNATADKLAQTSLQGGRSPSVRNGELYDPGMHASVNGDSFSRRSSIQPSTHALNPAHADSFVPQAFSGGLYANAFGGVPAPRPRGDFASAHGSRPTSYSGHSLASRQDFGRDSMGAYPAVGSWTPNSQFGMYGMPIDYEGMAMMRQLHGMKEQQQQYELSYGLGTSAFPNPYVPNGPQTFQHFGPNHVRHAYEMAAAHNGAHDMSQILHDFKYNKPSARAYLLEDAFGHVVELSGDRDGSRWVQDLIEKSSSEDRTRIFNEVLPEALQLMTCVFGNYVIQQLFSFCDQLQKQELGKVMQGRIPFLACNPYGCRSIQTALDALLTTQRMQLINELQPEVLTFARHQHGNHVLQKCLTIGKPEAVQFIPDSLRGHLLALATNQFGCRIIQRCIESCTPDRVAIILEELRPGIANIIGDQYGNYVVQNIVLQGAPSQRAMVLDVVIRSFEANAKHKFASNVVEKCLVHGSADFHARVVALLVEDGGRLHESVVLSLIKDAYGNYVIQKLLEVLNDQDYHTFVPHLQPELQKARKAGCAKSVSSIEKKMTRSIGRDMAFKPETAVRATAPAANNCIGSGRPDAVGSAFAHEQ